MPLTPVRQTLPNGVTVLAKENHTRPRSSLVAACAPARYDDAATAKAPPRCGAGARSRHREPHRRIRLPTISMGAAPRCPSSPGGTRWRSPPPAWPTISRRCSRSPRTSLRHPVFPMRDIETRRDELITSIRQEEDDPASMAVDAPARARSTGRHPYARMVRGTVERWRRCARRPRALPSAALRPASDHRRGRGRRPRRGGNDRGGVRGAGHVGAGRGVTPRVSVPDADRGHRRAGWWYVADDEQVAGRRGLRLHRHPPLRSRTTPPMSVMNNALGQYAIGGRLGDSIRERQGMAYYVFSSLDATLRPGPVADPGRRVRGQRREDDRLDR